MSGAGTAREWFSLDDEEGTWLFDVTFLASSWQCIWGAGCPGIDDEPDVDAALGCCTFGAHFADDGDHRRVSAAVERLGPSQWQLRPADGQSPFVQYGDGWTTSVVDGACIFLNRPPGTDDAPTDGDEAAPAGCVLHSAAVAAGERPLDWKPEVCWQLPLRLEHHTDESGADLHTLRDWRRRDWGDGGDEFGWWCTEEPAAFSGHSAVYESLADEIAELVGHTRYRSLADYLDRRRASIVGAGVNANGGTMVMLPHPAVRPTPEGASPS